MQLQDGRQLAAVVEIDGTRYPIPLQQLRRGDTGDILILPIDKEHLDQRYDQGVIGWGGDGFQHEEITHLGVFRLDVKADQQGTVVVGRDGFKPYTGWGIGHRHNVRDQGMAMVWNGRQIPNVALEISVTSGSLNATEKSRLLFDRR